ncbi:MAG: hypothetical protein H0U49_11590 [Parachlamydiaceae bacterium]|nr:hypothetical protein [Parachlamydiaceae bacterium]
MYTYRNLLYGYATALIFSSSIIGAQQTARPLNEISQEQQQQFTGTRNDSSPQQPRKANVQNPAPVSQSLNAPPHNRFSGNRETARPIAASSAQVQQGSPQQFTGHRE